MNPTGQTEKARRIVLISAAGLFLVWIATHLYTLTASQNGILRFFLTALFSLMILLRPKPERAVPRAAPPWLIALLALAGLSGMLGGIVFNVHQCEWIGLLLLLGACLLWAFPPRASRDILLALLLAYWAHPLPNQAFFPMQLAMQKMSVRGAEWLLHLGNVRVWADGFVLRTGFNAYEVPEWCSGMRTATTVFLLALGLGVLNRLAWYECAPLVALALAQALLLNILRICAMVLFAPSRGDQSGAEFLHNSGGFLVVAAVFLVYVEISLWRSFRERQAAARQELAPGLKSALSDNPPFWHRLNTYKFRIAAALLGLLLAAAMGYRSRPSHRLNMIRDVAIGLRDSGRLEDAERAARLVQEAFPEDEDWKMTRIRLQLLRGKYDEVLSALNGVPATSPMQQTQKDILQAYALMGLKRLPEAAAIVQKLPEDIKRNNPRVAVILMEWGYYANNPDMVAEYIVPASRWLPNDTRIRALYPFLRQHQKWQAIVKSDSRAPYDEPVQGFAAMEAYMNQNDTSRLAGMIAHAEHLWPDDLRTLEPLFFLAIRRGEGNWDERFARRLIHCMRKDQSPDVVYRYFEKCFELARPDLAWLLYRRIRAADPSHPALPLAAVRSGDSWFSFRRRHLGLAAAREDDRVDARPFYLLAACLPAYRHLCDEVPLAAELSVTNTVPVRKRLLQESLAEFAKRDAGDRLSLEMQYEYVRALDIAEQPEKARDLLRRIAERHPDRSTGNRFFLSEIYERQVDWQNVYETLRGYVEAGEPQQLPLLRLCRAEMSLHLGLAASYTARLAAGLFPDSSLAASVLADSLMRYDSPEEALRVLRQPRLWHQREIDVHLAECLYATERYREADDYCRAVFIPPMDDLARQAQKPALPPAELALLWHHVYTPSTRDFDENARVLRENLKVATSPFLRDMIRLWLECYAAQCAGPSADVERWLATGRDRFEQAALLNQLTLLLCWQEKLPEARAVARQAVEKLPEAPLLWRILISLSAADRGVVAAARKACPQDSEIWLADLVLATQTNAPGGAAVATNAMDEAWALAHLSGDDARVITPAAMTRAGEYLLRIGMPKAAAAAARDAVSRANGLLPAYILGVCTALKSEEKAWAVTCTKRAIESSLNPPAFFYEKLVQLKSADDPMATDSDMVYALRRLRETDPENPVWMQMLGYVSYKRGGVEMIYALYEMSAAIERGVTNSSPYVIAAEAARFLGNTERAKDLLRKGLSKYPDDLPMQNNLVYLLATDKATASDALQMLPALTARAPAGDLNVQDTVAVTYLRNELLDKAEEALGKTLAAVPGDSHHWFRATLHMAEIACARGQPTKARRLLEEGIKQARGIPDDDILMANLILSSVTTPTNGPARPPAEARPRDDRP